MRYEIKDSSFPVAVCNLENGEKILCQRGAMLWMSPNMQMETHAQTMTNYLTKESIFANIYTARGCGTIAFGIRFPGRIIPFNISYGHEIILQNGSFLASEIGVRFTLHFAKKLSVALFGGEGLFMQRFSGNGTVFAEVDGDLVVYDLQPGQQIVVDTGAVVGFTPGVQMDIQEVPSLKNKLLGGEGFFNTVLTGPGRVWLQTITLATVAASISRYIPRR